MVSEFIKKIWKKMRIKKRGIALESLSWWLIAIAVLVIILVFAYLLKDKLWEMGTYIKNLFRRG